MKCCNKKLELHKTEKGEVYYYCPTCKKGGRGKTEKEAANAFNNIKACPPVAITKELQPVPKNKDLVKWAAANMPALLNQSAQFIDKPATQRMIEKNVRYISNLSGYSWDKVWNSPEGQESISHALSEALYHAATLPEMGSIVPFGKTAEFIPANECYEFIMTTGKNPPFEKDSIFNQGIFGNDQTKSWSENGEFHYKIDNGMPRGEIIGIVVGGIRTDSGKRIGDSYDEQFLMSIAEHHSSSYKQYLIEKADFQRMKVEGKLKVDTSNREYYIKEIKKRDGGIWKKEIYEDDIKNPYVGPDKVKMLMKTAGKHFFKKYVKTRNAAAMAGEWEGESEVNGDIDIDQAADDVLNKAAGQFQSNDHTGVHSTGSPEIKDAEIVTDKKENTNKSKSEVNKNEEKIDL